MPDQHVTIIDQLEVDALRRVIVRVGLLTLDGSGEPDPEQTKYVRFGFEPGDDPAQIFAAASSYLQSERGRDPLTADHQDFVFKVGQAAHDQGAIDNFREYMAALTNGPRDARGNVRLPDQSALKNLDLGARLGRLGANVRNVPGAAYQEASYVDSLVIPRNRRAHVHMASVHLQGGKELARIENVGRMPPGTAVLELVKIVNAGLVQRGRMQIGAGPVGIVSRALAAIHPPAVVAAYQAGYAARVQALIARGLDPATHRVELADIDAVRVAMAYKRA